MSAVSMEVVAPAESRCFTSDNTAGGAPEIIAAVAATASGQAPPYGTDSWTSSARRRFCVVFDREVDLLPVSLIGTAEANILFCRLPEQVIDGLLAQGYGFYHGRWEPGVARFVTSFATTPHDVDELVHAVRRLTAAAIEQSRPRRARTQKPAGGRRSEVAYMGRIQ